MVNPLVMPSQSYRVSARVYRYYIKYTERPPKKPDRSMILIVDDEYPTLDIYRLMVVGTEYASQLVTFEQGEAALQWLHQQHKESSSLPRYILVDLRMPKMSGFEFIEHVEQAFDFRQLDTRLIALSNSIRQEEYQRALRYESVKDYVAKPLSYDQLIAFITASIP